MSEFMQYITKEMTDTELKTALTDIRQTATDLYRFTDKITLLKMMNQIAIQIIKATDTIQKEIHNLSGDKLFNVLDTSKSVFFLEDAVDADTISELESYILPFANELNNAELTCFLSEITDKVETKYNATLQKIHQFNALIKDELE